MRALKTFALAIVCFAMTGPAFADAAMTDVKVGMHDAEFETLLADHGYVVGVAAYGQNDADYDVHLSDANLFQPVLGHYDADYEPHINPSDFTDTEIALR